MGANEHWDEVYRTRPATAVSWYEDEPARSVDFVRAVAPTLATSVVDVGAGASPLVDRLVAAGYADVTILDVSQVALDQVRARLGELAGGVRFVLADVRHWRPDRTFDVWHDRAVFHFMVDDSDRERYVDVLRMALRPGGHAVLATFAPSGPEWCSGLPTMRYDAASLVAALGAGFTLVRADTADHVTPAGVVQRFTWVVVRKDG